MVGSANDAQKQQRDCLGCTPDNTSTQSCIDKHYEALFQQAKKVTCKAILGYMVKVNLHLLENIVTKSTRAAVGCIDGLTSTH